MKNTSYVLLILLICKVSFSQEKNVDSLIATNNNLKPSVFKFHPNPVEDDLFILGTKKIKSVAFIDVLGNPVVKYTFNKSIIKINVSDLKSGIYLLQVIDENNRLEIKRLMVK